jgi:DNA-directed RNA polymerase sigma subunit (sigma70/sigma32)
MSDYTKEDMGLANNYVLEDYINDAGKHEILSIEQEKKLSDVILNSENDAEKEKAINELVMANIRLVIKEAKNYYRKIHNYSSATDIMDLISIGNLSLFKAARKFDASYGKFSTYAVPTIQRDMSREFHNMKFLRIPEHYYTGLSRIIQKERLGEQVGDNEDNNGRQ